MLCHVIYKYVTIFTNNYPSIDDYYFTINIFIFNSFLLVLQNNSSHFTLIE